MKTHIQLTNCDFYLEDVLCITPMNKHNCTYEIFFKQRGRLVIYLLADMLQLEAIQQQCGDMPKLYGEGGELLAYY